MSEFLDNLITSALARPPVVEGSPRSFILMGPPKVGKSTLAGALPDALHIVCDPNGAANVVKTGVPPIDIEEEVQKYNEQAKPGEKISRYDYLIKLCHALKSEQPRRFKRVIIDKLDNVETWSEGEATAYYKTTVIGKNFSGRSVRELDKGGGYSYFWDSFTRAWNAMVKSADQVLFLAAVKETELDRGAQGMLSRKDLDLTGKVKNIAAGYAEVLGLVTRNEMDENWITFATKDKGALAGSRLKRLEGKMFKVSWKDPAGNVIVRWDDIYTDLQTREEAKL